MAIVVQVQYPALYIKIGIPCMGDKNLINVDYGNPLFDYMSNGRAYYNINAGIPASFSYSNQTEHSMLGLPIKLYAIYARSDDGSYSEVEVNNNQGYFVQLTQNGTVTYPAFYSDDQTIANYRSGNNKIIIGRNAKPEPTIGRSFSFRCGDGIKSISFGCHHADGSDTVEFLYKEYFPGYPIQWNYHYEEWAEYDYDITAILINGFTTDDNKNLNYNDLLVLRDYSIYDEKPSSYTIPENGNILNLEFIYNKGYIYNFRILSGVSSFDVYRHDYIHDTDIKLGTVIGQSSWGDIKRYQHLRIENIIPIGSQDIFYVYSDEESASEGYQTSYGSQVDRIDGEVISLRNWDRHIQVQGIALYPTCGIKLGSGIASCRIEVSDPWHVYTVRYQDGYKNKYFTFTASASAIIYVSDIVLENAGYQHPYTLTFYDSETDVTSSGSFQIKSGNSGNYLIEQERFFCVIAANGKSVTQVRIETTGINTSEIYSNGTKLMDFGSQYSITSDTITVLKNALVEIISIGVTEHYDPLGFNIKIYANSQTNPWYDDFFDSEKGLSFSADDDYAKIVITGRRYSQKLIYLRRNSSIVKFNGTIRGTRVIYITDYSSSEPISAYAYPDTKITLASIQIETEFINPLVLSFYDDSSYSNKIESNIISDNRIEYITTQGHEYAEISASIPNFTWYDTEAEDKAISPGADVSTHLTESRWKKFLDKLESVYSAYGMTFDYGEYDKIATGKPILATLFNDLIDFINVLPNRKQLPSPTKGTGATVYAEYFQSQNGGAGAQGYSIKDSLNSSIDYYNGK